MTIKIVEFMQKYLVLVLVFMYLIGLGIFTLIICGSVIDWGIYFRFVITLSAFMVYAFFLTVRQYLEVIRPANWLTGLRVLLLGVLVMTTLTFIPSIFNQYYLSIGQSYPVLRSVSVILGAFNLIGTTIFMIMIYTYKKHGD